MFKLKVFFNKLLFFITILVLSYKGLLSQTHRADKWVFGIEAGLSFSTGIPAPYGPTSIHAINENSSVVCDEFGNLLFYSSGDTVWDKTHTPMPNGTGLTGNLSSSQGVLITPVIGTCDRYYVFTGVSFEQMGLPPGLRYSVVDMSLVGNGTSGCPLGDIVPASKNIRLTNPPLTDSLDEKITSVMHSNGTDYWIIIRELTNSTYYSFLVTATGINPVPVISATGTGNGLGGYLKPSKDGRQLVGARTIYYGGIPTFTEIIDFNNTTGILSNAVKINTGINNSYYGVSFSCDDSLIYVSGFPLSGGVFEIYQYQRYAPVVSTTETVIANPLYQGALQLGPDGKIYHSDFMQNTFSVINNPSSLLTPSFSQSSVPLLPAVKSTIGVPNIFHGYEKEFCKSFSPVKTFTICSGDSVVLGENFYTTCHNYSWLPAAGLNSTTLSNPTASPTVSTTYTITVNTLNCDTYVDTFRVFVNPVPVAIISGDTMLCMGQSTTLTASAANSYNWNTGATTGSISVSPTSTTTYSVTLFNGICFGSASITVTVSIAPSAAILGSGNICIGETVTLSSSSSSGMYSWSTGSTTNSITVNPTVNTTYYLTATDSCGSAIDSLEIVVHPLPVISCSGNDTICFGGNILLSASGGSNYSWSPSTGLSSSIGGIVTASPSTNSSYTVTGTDVNGCSNMCSIGLTVLDLPIIDAGQSYTISYGNSIQLSASGSVTYLWSPSAGLSCITCADPIAGPSATTVYYVTTTDANGCSATDSLVITVDLVCGDVFVPNAFSPNADGENDVLYVYTDEICVKNFLLRIYNRWGEIVFEAKKAKDGWDGFYKGQPMNSDVFTYVISISFIDKSDFSRSGNINLIR